MKCIEFEQLAAYVDGVLDQEEKLKIEKHLEFCPSCRAVVETLQKEDSFLEQAINSPVLPAGFDEEVLSKLELYQPKKKKWNWTYQLITAASIVLAFGVGAAFYGGIQQESGGSASKVPVEAEKDLPYQDQIIVNVKEVSASPLKIEIFYEVKPSAAVLEEFLKKNKVTHLSQVNKEYWPFPRIKLTDGNGLELPMAEISSYDQDSLVLKPAEMENLPDKINVEMEFKELFMTSGNWKVQVPIDLTESKATVSNQSIQEKFEFDTFQAEILEWKYAHNSNRISVQTSYTEAEKERLQTILQARGDESKFYPFIEPEMVVMTEDGKKLVIGGRVVHSERGKAFRTEFEFLNRTEGMALNENIELEEKLLLRLEGFRLQGPENTQFDLTDQSKNVQVNDWTIDSVTTKPGNGSTKVVTIKGKTTIQNIETMITEIKTDKEWVSPDIFPTVVEPDGTFTIETTLPNSTTRYFLDIQILNLWRSVDEEVFVFKR